MSASGVKVNSEVHSAFSNLCDRRKENRYIIFKIEEGEIVVETAVSQLELAADQEYQDNSKDAFEKIAQDLRTRTNAFTDCRYAVFDFKFTFERIGAGMSKCDKIVFVQLCPGSAPLKSKMLYASSSSAIKNVLDRGRLFQFQVGESGLFLQDILSTLLEKYSRNMR